MRAYPPGDLRNRDPKTIARSPAQFVLMIAMRLIVSPITSSLPRDIYREFLADEKIEFGDPRYDWTYGGAGDIARNYMTECA
jgi:hypothetical protein